VAGARARHDPAPEVGCLSGPGLKETKTWGEFVNVAEESDVGNAFQAAYAFRGQPRACWETLRPSLRRHVDGLQPDAAIKVEQLLLRRFQAQAFTHLPHGAAVDRVPTTLLGWWCLMQHYGVPTRLLDWTRSMYVAAYFAVESEPEHDGAVWVVHSRTVQDAMRPLLKGAVPLEDPQAHWRPDAQPDLQFVGPTRETDRMTAQQTLFSLSRWVLADHGAIIGDVVSQKQGIGKPVHFCKVVIPRQSKLQLLRRLHQMTSPAARSSLASTGLVARSRS